MAGHEFQINEQAGSYQLAALDGASQFVREANAVFICDGVEHHSAEMTTLGIERLTSEKTFGACVTQRWTLLKSGVASLSFGLELTSYPGKPWHTIQGWVENKSDAPVSLRRFILLRASLDNIDLGGSWSQWRVLSDDCGTLDDASKVLSDKEGSVKSRVAMALGSPTDDRQALLGFSAREAYGKVELLRNGDAARIEMSSVMDEVLIAPGQKRYSELAHIGMLPAVEAMKEFADATGREAKASLDAPSFTGWCSWYAFNPFWDMDVTEDRVLDYAEASELFRSEIPLSLMLLDDGYQTLPGDWTTLRPLFPHGMKWLADRVKEKGLIPGIWVAAPLVHADSELMKKHPDWVVRNADGSPYVSHENWGGLTHSLDITRPDVLEHLRELFHVICQDWGFQYVKLDFNETPDAATRHDCGITSFQALRRMYEVIREAVGPDVFIANCSGSLFPASIGIAQIGRTSGDVLPNWASVKEGCRKNILRSPFHRRWWVNDPDCVMLRKEPQSTLSIDELRTHLAANLLCGGHLLFADELQKLPPERRRMLAQTMPAYGHAAEIMDLMSAPEPGIPRVLRLSIQKPWESYVVAGVFNWSDEPAELTLQLAELGLDAKQHHHVFEFWSDSYLGEIAGDFQTGRMKPHSCRLYAIRPVLSNEIQLVSTDLHLLQGALEITGLDRQNTSPFNHAKAELTLSIKPASVRSGRVVFAADDTLVLAACQGARAEMSHRKDGLWEVNLTQMADHVALLLRIRI